MCLSDLHGRQLIQALAALGLIAVGLDTKAQVPAPAPTSESSKSVQSPYFAVQDDSGVDHFPMKETKVTVKLNGVIASVHVHQHYRNEGNKPINAKYVFPGSTRAAMNGMSMTIGNRRIKAQIKEKEQAQQMFAAAKAAGQTASLLAQKRPNVFSMDVANIGAGSEVDVDMDYTEFLTATEGEYEFVYPGVVGPRYGGDADRTDAPVKWISNPYLKAGDSSPVAFDIDVQMDSPIALRDLTSSTHRVITRWNGAKSVDVSLDEPKQTAGNRDFILHYRLQGDAIVTGLTRFQSAGESYFMLQAQPPQRVTGSELPPREYVFILDVSGSMDGFPLDTGRDLIGKLLASLRPQDRFNILFFAGGSSVLSPESLPATPENFLRAGEMLKDIKGGGGTELLPALQQALAMKCARGHVAQPGADHGRLRLRRGHGLQAGRRQSRQGQSVHLRHRHLGEPLPARGPGEGGPCRDLRRHQRGGCHARGRALPAVHFHAGDDQHPGPRPRRGDLRRRAAHPARPAGAPAGAGAGQVPQPEAWARPSNSPA